MYLSWPVPANAPPYKLIHGIAVQSKRGTCARQGLSESTFTQTLDSMSNHNKSFLILTSAGLEPSQRQKGPSVGGAFFLMTHSPAMGTPVLRADWHARILTLSLHQLQLGCIASAMLDSATSSCGTNE